MYKLTGQKPTKSFYTYLLINPISKKPFYVGKGKDQRYLSHFKEAITGKGTNKHKINTIKKILAADKEVIIEMIYVSDNEAKCFAKEVELIKQHGRRSNKSGILTNLTDGGEGVSGADFSKANRKSMVGEKNPMFGKPRSREVREKISETRRKKLASGEIIPTKHTEAHKQKLRENNAGGKATAKEIYQVDDEGKVVNKWPSSREAGLSLGLVKSWHNISLYANHYPKWRVGKFYWRWVDQVEVRNGKIVGFQESIKRGMKFEPGKLYKPDNIPEKFQFYTINDTIKSLGPRVSIPSGCFLKHVQEWPLKGSGLQAQDKLTACFGLELPGGTINAFNKWGYRSVKMMEKTRDKFNTATGHPGHIFLSPSGSRTFRIWMADFAADRFLTKFDVKS